jgi:peptidoglycan/xylan/chitin deacetylase (PgdA/CDA1 family)
MANQQLQIGGRCHSDALVTPCSIDFKDQTRQNWRGMFARWMTIVWILVMPVLLLEAVEPGRLYTQGPAGVKCIALSFDDGPGPETPRLLELLDRHQVKATFFLSGEMLEKWGSAAREAVKRGHELGSHTYEHRNYLQHYRDLAKGRPAAEAEAQAERDLVADMRRAHADIHQNTTVQVRLCRMPHGIDRPWVRQAARTLGYALVNWTYGADWQKGTAAELLPGYLGALRPGAIFLFHDGGRNRSKSFQLAEAVIREAKKQGLKIVTVGELLSSGNGAGATPSSSVTSPARPAVR